MVRKMSLRAEDDGDVIDVDVSDDEKYNSDNVFQGLWIPYPDQVAEMFEKLDKGGVPVLKWRCPGRRPPEIEKEEEDMETDLNLAVEPKQEEQKEEKIAPAPTEFDFDDTSLETSTKLTPRKTPGSSKGKKRVARMDKVLDDMIRQRKATEASKDQRKKVTPKTPRGAAGGRFFSSPRTPMSAEKYAPSITPPTTPRSSGAKSPHNRLLGAKYTSPFRSAPTSPRTPSSPKTPTSAERTPATSPVGSAMMTGADKAPSPNVAKVTEADASEGTAKTTCVSTTITSMSSTTTKCTPLTQALMSEPMVSSHVSDNSLFNKPRNSLPQVTTHPVSNTAIITTTTTTTTTTTAASTASSAPVSSSNSSAHAAAATHQHFSAAQTVGSQRPSLSLFAHQNSGVGQGSPQSGMVRVTQAHLPNSPLAQPAQSPHAQSPLSQPAHSPMTHTSLSPMSHNVQSPMTQHSHSPLSQPIQSPMSQTTHSPISQSIQSPMSQHSQSPMAHSPMAQPVQSPMSQPAQSPTSQSPLAQMVQSPSASQSPISQVGQLRGMVQQNIPGAKPRLTLSGKPRISTPDKPRLSMASKPRLSLASPLTVSTSTIQSHLSSTPTLQAQLNQAVQHQVLQQHLNQTNQQQVSQLVQQRAQAISQQQMNQAVAQQQMASVTESAPAQLSQQQQQLTQQQQQLAQQLQLNQQSQQAQLSQQQQQQLAQQQQQQQLAQQQLSQQQQLQQQLSQQQAQTPQLTPQQKQQLTLALAQQQLNQQQQTGTQSMSPQMAHQLSQLIKQQKIQVTLRQQRAAQQQQQMAQVKAQQLVSTQQIVQQQLAQINAQQMAQTTSQPQMTQSTSQPQMTQSTVQISQASAQPNVTAASPAPKVWSKPSSQHQLLQAALSQVPQNQTSLSQMIQAVKSRMNPATHPQLFKSISQLTQANQSQLNQGSQLHVSQPQSTLTSSSPKLSTLVMGSQSTTTPTQIVSSTTPFLSSDNVQNTSSSQASGHITQVVYHSQASHVTNPSHIGPPPITSIAQATTQQLSPAITQPSLLVRKEETIPAQHTQLGIQRNESSDYKLSIFTQASTPSATVTTAESVAAAAQFVSQAQATRTDASQNLSRMLPNLGRKSTLTGEIGGLSTAVSVSEMPTSQASTNIGQSIQTSTTQTRFVPSNLLQTSTESSLRERFAAPTEAIASNQERFTLSTMGQAMNRSVPPAVSQASELPSPSGRERLTLASMLQPFDLAGLSQQEKQTLSTLTQSRDLSFLQNSESEGNTVNTQQFSTINKAGSTVGFPQTHMQIGESQAPAVSQSYIMPSYGVSAMIGKPPPPYSVAIAEKALSSMRTSMAGRKDPNIVSQLPTSGTDKTVTFVKKPETSLPSPAVSVWVNTPNTSSEVGTNIVSSQSSVVTPQLTTAGATQVSVQKISLQQPQQSAATGEINKALNEKDDKQTLDLVNNSLSAVRTAISMGNHMYSQSVPKDNLLIRKNLLGFSSLNKPSTVSDTTNVTTTGTSSIAANNSLLQHMLGTSTSEHLTSTSHLIPSMSHMSTQELNLQKMSLSSASVTSSSNLGALTTSFSHSQPSTTLSTPSTRPRLTTIAALLNIDSGPKTQAELQMRQLAMAGLTADGQKSTLGQTLGVISPVTSYSTEANKTVSSSSITTPSQITMVPATVSKPNVSNQPITSTFDSSQTEQQQLPTTTSSES